MSTNAASVALMRSPVRVTRQSGLLSSDDEQTTSPEYGASPPPQSAASTTTHKRGLVVANVAATNGGQQTDLLNHQRLVVSVPKLDMDSHHISSDMEVSGDSSVELAAAAGLASVAMSDAADIVLQDVHKLFARIPFSSKLGEVIHGKLEIPDPVPDVLIQTTKKGQTTTNSVQSGTRRSPRDPTTKCTSPSKMTNGTLLTTARRRLASPLPPVAGNGEEPETRSVAARSTTELESRSETPAHDFSVQQFKCSDAPYDRLFWYEAYCANDISSMPADSTSIDRSLISLVNPSITRSPPPPGSNPGSFNDNGASAFRTFPIVYRPMRVIRHHRDVPLTNADRRESYRRIRSGGLNKRARILKRLVRQPLQVRVPKLDPIAIGEWSGHWELMADFAHPLLGGNVSPLPGQIVYRPILMRHDSTELPAIITVPKQRRGVNPQTRHPVALIPAQVVSDRNSPPILRNRNAVDVDNMDLLSRIVRQQCPKKQAFSPQLEIEDDDDLPSITHQRSSVKIRPGMKPGPYSRTKTFIHSTRNCGILPSKQALVPFNWSNSSNSNKATKSAASKTTKAKLEHRRHKTASTRKGAADDLFASPGIATRSGLVSAGVYVATQVRFHCLDNVGSNVCLFA